MNEVSPEVSDQLNPFRDADSRPLVSNEDVQTRLRLALDAGRMAIWNVDASGNVEVSPEFNRLLRLPDDSRPTLEDLLSRYYPGELERVQELVGAITASGQRYGEWEYRHLWPNDEVRWLLVRAEFFRDDDGNPAGSIGVIMDITERKDTEERRHRAEKELRQTVTRLRVAQAAGRIGSFELLPDQRLIRVSDEFCRLWGMPLVEEAPVTAFIDLVYEEDRPKLETWRKQLPPGALDYVEYRIRRGDTGELRWMARRGEAVADEESGTVRYFGVAYDITNRVFREQRQQFLLDLSDAVRSAKSSTEIIQVAQKMLGEHLRANRVGYGEVEATQRYFTTTANWTDGVPSRHGIHDLAGFGPGIHDALRRGESLSVDDVRSDPRTNSPLSVAAFDAIDTQAAMTASLVVGGRMVAALYVHSKEPRRWTEYDINLVQDVAERTWAELGRARAEAQARASEERYRRIFEQTSDPIITATLDQIITDANEAAASAVGLSREQAVGAALSDFLSSESMPLEDVLQDSGGSGHELRVRDAGGETRYWEVNSGPTFDEEAHPMGLHLVARDVTERKRWERHQALLVAELNHRVKNTLAVVQSLAHQTFRRTSDPTEAIDAYEGRLNVLAVAHNLLTKENWESADISEVLTQALRPFCAPHRCSVEGPPVRLEPHIAVSLTLAAHELATNASKYGALSNDMGQVRVTWSETPDALEILWQETGGPAVQTPSREGFGTRMLRRALAQDVRGTVDIAFEPDGLQCRIVAPTAVSPEAG